MGDELELIWLCFSHFAHLDHSNAAIHAQPVRYSPITFRLAAWLRAADAERSSRVIIDDSLLLDVLDHFGAYPEDRGRVG